jgi:hypothetical protein
MPSQKITVILEPDADGTVHLPVPPELGKGRFKITARLEAVDEAGRPLPATPEMIERRMAALDELQKLNPFRDIEDPAAWQREIRGHKPGS